MASMGSPVRLFFTSSDRFFSRNHTSNPYTKKNTTITNKPTLKKSPRLTSFRNPSTICSNTKSALIKRNNTTITRGIPIQSPKTTYIPFPKPSFSLRYSFPSLKGCTILPIEPKQLNRIEPMYFPISHFMSRQN